MAKRPFNKGRSLFKKAFPKESEIKKIKKDVRNLKKNEEMKYIDYADSPTVGTAGYMPLLCVPVVGTSYNQRTGRKIVIKKVEVVIRCISNALATAGTAYHASLVRATDPKGVSPTIADIFDSPATGFRDPDYNMSYKISHTKLFSTNTSGGNVKWIKLVAKPNCVVEFNSTSGGTYADIISNAMYLYMYSNETTNYPSVYVYSRCYYVDA